MALQINRTGYRKKWRYKHTKATAKPKKRAVAAEAPWVPNPVEGRTVFVWPRMGMRCGIGEYVKQLCSVADGAASCRYTSEVRRAEHVVLVLMPSLNEPVPSLVEYARRMRRAGVRVTLDVHHLTVGQNPFAPLFGEVNDVIWHLPSMPALAGGGRYVPLPVPELPAVSGPRRGGLVHFGLGHASKRVPVMAKVAQALGSHLYIYGDRNKALVPPDVAHFVTATDSFPSEHDLTYLIRQHDVGLIGRKQWTRDLQLNGSASARFFIAAGLPAVIDRAPAHEDLVDVMDVVPFDDFRQLVTRVHMLVHDQGYRAQALERARQYAERTTPRHVAAEMGIAVKA